MCIIQISNRNHRCFWQKDLFYDLRDSNSIRHNQDGMRTCEDYLGAAREISNLRIPNMDGLRIPVYSDFNIEA